MRRWPPASGLLACLAILAPCWAIAEASARADESAAGEPGREVFPFPVHQTELPNGLTVMSVEYDSPGIIAYYTVVRTGSRNEVEEGLSGFAHFFEHMMFRGTPRFSEGKYNEVLKGLGADSNAFTTDDWTCYHITASAAALETIVDIESDRFQNLKYDEASFQKEARAVLGEYNKSASSPLLLLDEKMQDHAFTQHTYKHTTIGFLRDIENMPNQYDYSLKFFDRWYRPDNCIVLVVGDVRHDRLVALASQYYGNWKRGAAQVEIAPEPPQTEERKLALEWPGRTLPYLYIGYHVPGFDPKSRDIAALDLLGEAVFSETSPLYRQLVLEQRKVERLQGSAPFRRDPTLFTVLARLSSEQHIDSVREAIYDTFEQAARRPIDEQRLADIKSHLRYHFVMNLDSPDAVARTLGEFLQLSANPDSVNQMYATYEAVTAEEIQRVASKYFVPQNRTSITLTMRDRQGGQPAAGPGPVASRPTRPVPWKFTPAGPLQSGTASSPISGVSTNRQTTASSPQATCSEPEASSLQNLEPHGSAPAALLPLAPTIAGQQPSSAPAATTLLNPKSPLVALRVVLRVGSKDDPPGKEGLAALVARMLAEGGSRRYSYDQILERLYPMAGQIDSHCDKETTAFTGDVHRDKLAEFYELFSEMILAPRFDPADFERLREEQINYLAKTLRGNDDENLGKWTLQLALFPDHPYGHVDTGTVSGLRAVTLEDVKQFYANHYSVGRVRIGVAGGADDAFVSRAQQDFSAFPAGSGEPRGGLPEPYSPQGIELTIVEKDCIATAISIGFPLHITRSDDDFYALAVANSALGEHRTFNGRLMINMRGKRGLNYGDYSYIENFIQDGGSTFPLPNIARSQQHFSIWIRPVPHDKALFALRQAIRELDTLVRDGLSEQEFEMTRRFLQNYSKLWVQTLSRRLGYEMDGKFYGRASVVAELERRLPNLTREQVNAAIRKHLQSKNLCVAVVTRDADSFRAALLSGAPSPLEYDTEGTPQEILQEDKRIEAYPLGVARERLRIVPVDQMFE